MIVETKAIEPTPGLANSTYAAIILNIEQETQETTQIRFYCPDTMGNISLNEAKMTTNNLLSVPTYLFYEKENENKQLKYNYQIGGLIMISYQNGNLNSPQFVKLVDISENIIALNLEAITNDYIRVDEESFGISENGSYLVNLLKECINILPNNVYSLYYYDSNSNSYLTIYKCSPYGIELTFKRKDLINSIYDTKDDSLCFDYYPDSKTVSLDKKAYYSNVRNSNSIFNLIYNNEDLKILLIKYINMTIYNLYHDKIKEGHSISKVQFAFNDNTVFIFWLSQILGYSFKSICELLNYETDTSKVPVNGIQYTYLKNVLYGVATINGQMDFYNDYCINAGDTIYRAAKLSLYSVVKPSDPEYVAFEETNLFLNEFWSLFTKDSKVQEILDKYFNIIFTNINNVMVQNYGSQLTVTKTICTVISVLFPALEDVLVNLGNKNTILNSPDNKTLSFLNILESYIKGVRDHSEDELPYGEDYGLFAHYLQNLYYYQLGFGDIKFSDIEGNKTFANTMSLIISYIYTNWSRIKQQLKNSSNNTTPSGGTNLDTSDYSGTYTKYNDKYWLINSLFNSNDFALQQYLFNECNKYNIPHKYMLAVIWQESNFNQYAHNSASNDFGLCQINKRWHLDSGTMQDFVTKRYNQMVEGNPLKEEFANFDVYNVYQNLAYGCQVMYDSWIALKTGKPFPNESDIQGLAIAYYSYNAGSGGAGPYVNDSLENIFNANKAVELLIKKYLSL